MTHRLTQLVRDVRTDGPRAQRAAAQLMTTMIDDPERGVELLAGSNDWPQPRLVLGLTGAPGSGKSSLADRLAAEFRTRRPEQRLGIIAVDPSSPFTGGALLGDRVRMMRHATDPGVFIRSLATRGRLGGLAAGVRGVVRVMGLAGCDVVIVETVGVGQSEVEIAQAADLVLVLLAPGQGDSVQLLKAGLMEAGDLFVVNKADRAGAEQLRQQLLALLALDAQSRRDLGVGDAARAAYSCSAARNEGVGAIVDAIEALADRHAGEWLERRGRQTMDDLRRAVVEAAVRRVDAALGVNGSAGDRLEKILRGQASIEETARRLVSDVAAHWTPPNGPSAPPAATSQSFSDAQGAKQ